MRSINREDGRPRPSHYIELGDSERSALPMQLSDLEDRPRGAGARPTKPGDLFIHPMESNVARADAAAIELGLEESTENVRILRHEGDEVAWQVSEYSPGSVQLR